MKAFLRYRGMKSHGLLLAVETAVILNLFAGTVWSTGSQLLRRAVKDRFLSEGHTTSTTCTVLPLSRLALNFIHACCILSTIWFSALLSYIITLLSSFTAAEKLAHSAMKIQLAEPVCRTLVHVAPLPTGKACH